MALLGDLNFDQIFELAPATAFVWFWAFMVVNFFILLNLLIAVVFDHYWVAKDTVGETKSFPSQVKEVFWDMSW